MSANAIAPADKASSDEPESFGAFLRKYFAMSKQETAARAAPVIAAAVLLPPHLAIPTVIASVALKAAAEAPRMHRDAFPEQYIGAQVELTAKSRSRNIVRFGMPILSVAMPFGMSWVFTTPNLSLAQENAAQAIVERGKELSSTDPRKLLPMEITRDGTKYTIAQYVPENRVAGKLKAAKGQTTGVDAEITFQDSAFLNTRSSHRTRTWQTYTHVGLGQ